MADRKEYYKKYNANRKEQNKQYNAERYERDKDNKNNTDLITKIKPMQKDKKKLRVP